MSEATAVPPPVTAVVRRRIRAGSEQDFESLMQDFVACVLRQPGHIGINVLRPAAGSREYTILDRFASEGDRHRFTQSEDYKRWMHRLREFSESEPVIDEMEGIAFWFTPRDALHPHAPPKVKMALLTLAGVYPLSMLFPALVVPVTPRWPAISELLRGEACPGSGREARARVGFRIAKAVSCSHWGTVPGERRQSRTDVGRGSAALECVVSWNHDS